MFAQNGTVLNGEELPSGGPKPTSQEWKKPQPCFYGEDIACSCCVCVIISPSASCVHSGRLLREDFIFRPQDRDPDQDSRCWTVTVAMGAHPDELISNWQAHAPPW